MKTLYERQGFTKSQYIAIHIYLNKFNKKTGVCERCGTSESKRTEWALMDGRTYSRDIDDYEELCPSCHRKGDFTEDMRLAASKRVKHGFKTGKYSSNLPTVTRENNPTNKPLYQIDKRTKKVIAEHISAANAVRLLGKRHASSICNCLYGKSKTAYGY